MTWPESVRVAAGWVVDVVAVVVVGELGPVDITGAQLFPARVRPMRAGSKVPVVESPKEQQVQMRAGSNNAVKIWLNGKLIYFREEYHHGMRMDQHTATGTLRAGRNTILIKVCQNEQTDAWAQKWDFQLRVCDKLGGAVPLAVVTDKVAVRPAEKEVRP